MKNYLLILLLPILCTNSIFCQSKKELGYIKKMALYTCLKKNYNLESTDSLQKKTLYHKDVSASFIFIDILSNYSLEQYKALITYVETETKDFNEILSFPPDYNTSGQNVTLLRCINFYHSKELKKFIKKQMRDKKIYYE